MTIAVWLLAAVLGAAQPDRPSPPVLRLGDVVLLSNSEPETAADRLREALGSTDPLIRAAAGRVIAAGLHGALRPALASALAREQDPVAGAELIRALLRLSGDADLAFLAPQAKRLGGDASLVLAEWFARVHPAQFVERLPQLREPDGTKTRGLDELVVLAVTQHPPQAQTVLRAWMPIADEGGWDDVLSAAIDMSGPTAEQEAVLTEALAAPRTHVRSETVWFVLERVIDGQPMPPRVIDAAGAPRADADAWEAFGRELIARRGTPPASGDRHEFIAAQGEKHRSDVRRLDQAPQLSSAERDAVRALLSPSKEPPASVRRMAAAMRTLPVFLPGVVTATFDAAKCRPGSTRAAAASVTFGPDGSPRKVGIGSEGLSKECTAAWTALVRTLVADTGRQLPPDESQMIVLPLTATSLACTDEVRSSKGSGGIAPAPVSGIKQPRKLKDVRPEYPVAAQRSGIQGVVVIESVISRRGCVSEARVLRSIPPLDVAAIMAVTAWEFTPTLLNGEPVPVIMTVTVNFALK